MKYQLEDRNALVCGSSQGIGLATAQLLAQSGAKVTLLARNEERLQHNLSELPGEGHNYISLDLNDSAALEKRLSQLDREYDILICNTGGPKGGPIYKAKDDEFIQAFRLHVIANSILFKALYPGMKKSGYGRVINVISTSVKAAIPNLGVSNTIRGAVANWSKTLSQEVAGDNITVNNVLPGFTKTPRLENLISGAAKKMEKSEDEIKALWQATIPMGRFAEPTEVAQAIAFLASPAASYINGINLPVDGGRTPSL